MAAEIIENNRTIAALLQLTHFKRSRKKLNQNTCSTNLSPRNTQDNITYLHSKKPVMDEKLRKVVLQNHAAPVNTMKKCLKPHLWHIISGFNICENNNDKRP